MASDSFIGEALTDSPYIEMRKRVEELTAVLQRAEPLIAACMNVALRWNDHNYGIDMPYKWCSIAAEEAGFYRNSDHQSAIDFLGQIERLTADK